MAPWAGTDSGPLQFADEFRTEDTVLRIALGDPNAGARTTTRFSVIAGPRGARVALDPGQAGAGPAALLTIPAAPADQDDDELEIELEADQGGEVGRCRVVLRRTRATIGTALVARDVDGPPIPPEMRAAILWFAWRRYSEVVALKRFTSGKSGSQVLVFRPKLREPHLDNPRLAAAHLTGVVSEAWGSYLLVKTGADHKVREEWDRFQCFLRDRVHPFMARSEAFLTTRVAGAAAPDASQATVIGSFLGGELMQAEPFEIMAQGTSDIERCEAILARLFSILSTWYSGSDTRPLGDWSDMLATDDSDRLLLFGKFDLTSRADRDRFAGALAWDVSFIREAHLSRHLIGKHGDGLLRRLARLPVRYSLVHGDLHPRNILADRDDVWLLDFGETGVAPTLFDFAKLEVYLRIWCLRLSADARDFENAAFAFETHMLDHMTASEGSLEPVAALADGLGATSASVLRIARCIADIRRQALRYSLGSPDRRDYLAVLYLTTLKTLRYAGSAPELAYNFRLVVALAWLLEDVLSVIVGLEPFERDRSPLDHRLLVNQHWLAAPGAPGRVKYMMDRTDGQKALAPLAGTRGVLQSLQHHLDVFDHTLLVLAYVEELLVDPLSGFRDPSALCERTEAALRAQGLTLPPRRDGAAPARPVLEGLDAALDDVRAVVARALDDRARLLLKWTALLHDVGKPATRGQGSRGRTQFIGHEIYGLQLVAGHLDRLFPEPEPRATIDRLIRWHHTHHTLVSRYLEPKRLASLRQSLAAGELPPDEDRFLAPYLDPDADGRALDFPLLMLHGFADTLACRGPESGPIAPVAEIDLALLAIYARYPTIKRRKLVVERFKDLIKGLDQAIGVSGPPLGRITQALRTWFVDASSATAGAADEIATPNRDQLIAQAVAIRDASPPSD